MFEVYRRMSSILGDDLGKGGILAVTNLEAKASAWCCVFRAVTQSVTESGHPAA